MRYDASHAQSHGAGLGWLRSTPSSHVPLAVGSGLHDADAGATPSERIARLEAVLFLAREPLSSRKLSQLANLADGTEARTLIRRLRERYDARGSSFQVVEIAGGFQLLTRSQFADWLRRLHGSPAEVRLSGPAMETLAVVAYRGPVLRAEIEAIRGVQCGEILRQLMDRDLVRIAGRSEELGRPFLYTTTKRFLQVFGLRHLDQLPRSEQLRAEEFAVETPVEIRKDEYHDIQNTESTLSETEEESQVSALDDSEIPGERPVDEKPAESAAEDLDDKEDEYEYEYVDDDEEDDDEEDEDNDDEEDEDDDEDDEEDDDDVDEFEYEEVGDDEPEDEEDDEDEWEDVDEDEDEDDEYEYKEVENNGELEDEDDEWEDVDDEDEEDDEYEYEYEDDEDGEEEDEEEK